MQTTQDERSRAIFKILQKKKEMPILNFKLIKT